MEMDIYMRRRLVALGGLVAFFILFVLVVKSCGGDDEPAPLEPTAGATGEDGAVPLTPQQFVAEADAICGEANTQVGGLDPTDPDATRLEFQITRDELAELQQLQVDDNSRQLRQFFSSLQAVVDALSDKAAAIQAGDTVAEDEAQVAIDTAEVEARAAGEDYGFSEFGQFLDAGEAPGGAAETGETAPPTDTGAVAPPTDTGVVPPAETTEPPADTGGVPPDDTGGVAP